MTRSLIYDRPKKCPTILYAELPTFWYQRLPTILDIYEWAGKKHLVSLKPKCQNGVWTRDLRLSKKAALTTAPRLSSLQNKRDWDIIMQTAFINHSLERGVKCELNTVAYKYADVMSALIIIECSIHNDQDVNTNYNVLFRGVTL